MIAITGPAICSPISYNAHNVNATAHHGLVSALCPNHIKNLPCAWPILFASLTIIVCIYIFLILDFNNSLKFNGFLFHGLTANDILLPVNVFTL